MEDFVQIRRNTGKFYIQRFYGEIIAHHLRKNGNTVVPFLKPYLVIKWKTKKTDILPFSMIKINQKESPEEGKCENKKS